MFYVNTLGTTVSSGSFELLLNRPIKISASIRFLSPLHCDLVVGLEPGVLRHERTCTMPHMPLCRKLLNQLGDVDQSFKCTRLAKYLCDASIEFPFPVSEGESKYDVSSVSSVSSVTSLSLLSSVDSDISHATLSPSDLMEFHYSIVRAEFDKLRHEIQADVNELFHEIQAEVNKFQHEDLTSRVLRRNPGVHYTPRCCPQAPPTETTAISAGVPAHSTVDTDGDCALTERPFVPAPLTQLVRAGVVNDAVVVVGQRQKKRKRNKTGGIGGERSEPDDGRAGKRLRSKKGLDKS